MNNYQFLDNKYTKIYWRLLSDKLIRKKFSGSHRHHIVPKSLGGSNEFSNLCYLTPREHYICHLLLTKMTSGKDRSKMVYAFFRFKEIGCNSRNYNKFVEIFRKSLCGEGNHFYGCRHSNETKEKIKKNHGMRGRSCVDVWIENYGLEEAKKRSDEMNRKKANTFIKNYPTEGRKIRSKEASRKQAEKLRGRKTGSWAWVNNGKEQKRIRPEDLDKYIANNWVQGMCRKPNNLKGYIRINNGVESKMVHPEKLEMYLLENWKKGTIRKPSERKNWVWINNNIESKQVFLNELDLYLSQNWVLGMCKKSKVLK